MSGVKDCKNEMGLGAYDEASAAAEEAAEMEEAFAGNVRPREIDPVATLTAQPTPSPVEEQFHSLGGKQTASKPSGRTKPGLTISAVTTTAATTLPPPPLLTYEQPMVRIILYGLASVLTPAALRSWKRSTQVYVEDFFNKYPTQQMLDEGDVADVDQIRSRVFDVEVEISDEVVAAAPVHDFEPLATDQQSRLRGRLLQTEMTEAEITGIDPARTIMITYSQTSRYLTTLDVINDDSSMLVLRRPLETPEYRAEYVQYLRSVDFNTFRDLEFVSVFLFTEFPTAAPTGIPTATPTESPVKPGEPTAIPNTPRPTTLAPISSAPTMHPTENFGCNLCRQGQYGVNANVIYDGELSTCMDVYNYFLTNFRQGSGACNDGADQLNEICCRDDLPAKKPTQNPTQRPTPDPTLRPTQRQAVQSQSEPRPVVAPDPTPRPTSPPVPRATPDPTPRPSARRATPKPTKAVAIPAEGDGLPDAASLSETYYCGTSWDAVDASCADAAPCPSGSNADCDLGEQCIAFTNCGKKFAFVSDPSVEGGGPDPEEVRSTFYCGTSMGFLNMECDAATPCPNGPVDCEGDGETFGCFAFTGCSPTVDPGKFVGFLRPPDETDVNLPLHVASNSFFCAANWADLDSRCDENGVPQGARACPGGDILECEDGQGCFAFACGNGLPVAQAPVASSDPSDFGVEDMDLLKSTFFCGTSLVEIEGDCKNAIPCPSGDECPEGYGCFAFSQCGGVDIDALTDTFGRTDRPTRAPTVPLEQVCDEQRKMSVTVGYWQSWSI